MKHNSLKGWKRLHVWLFWNFNGDQSIRYVCFIRLLFRQFHATNLHHALYLQQIPNPQGPHTPKVQTNSKDFKPNPTHA
jgi:hypothetical protein